MAGLASKTYNLTEEAPFRIETASSGRSKCRNPSCKGAAKTIRKGELRIARLEASPTDKLNGRFFKKKLFPKWVHMRCCAPVILQEAVDRYGGIEGVPGYNDLQPNKISEDPKAEAQELTPLILLRGIKNQGPGESSKTETKPKTKPKSKSKAAVAKKEESAVNLL